MNSINISKQELENITLIELPKEVFNSESDIYRFTYLNKPKIIKTLFTDDEFLLKNKLYTIEQLNLNKDILPQSFCIPEHIVKNGDNVFGFTMPFYEGESLSTILNNSNISIQEKIYYLKKIGLLLDELKIIRENTNVNNIYINDLHDSNILINPYNKEMKIIDLDSCKIGTNCSFIARFLSPFSVIAEVESKYKKNNSINSGPGYIEADENTDIYCYIMIILNYFTNGFISRFNLKKFYDYLDFLRTHQINKELIDIFEIIVKKDNNINPVELLDTLTEKQINSIKADSKKFIKIK